MEVLWDKGASPAEAIREALPDEPHDSTVRTLLRILHKKGYVRIRGRQPAVYEPKIDRSTMQIKAARSLVARFFGGSIQSLVLRLLEDEQISPQELRELRKSFSKRERKGSKP
jgi:BlaI family transcriptional regulator, penicillinase repressor